MVLDALVGNTDRHHENWELSRELTVVEENGEARFVLSKMLAPTFDHGSSLGRELLEERALRLLEDRENIRRYIIKARGGIFRDSSESRGMSPIALLKLIAEKYPAFLKPWQERVRTFHQTLRNRCSIRFQMARCRPSASSLPSLFWRRAVIDRIHHMKSLYLAWQAPEDSNRSKAWFPIGRLDAEAEGTDIESFRFRYIGGAKRAAEEVGFDFGDRPLAFKLSFVEFLKIPLITFKYPRRLASMFGKERTMGTNVGFV